MCSVHVNRMFQRMHGSRYFLLFTRAHQSTRSNQHAILTKVKKKRIAAVLELLSLHNPLETAFLNIALS